MEYVNHLIKHWGRHLETRGMINISMLLLLGCCCLATAHYSTDPTAERGDALVVSPCNNVLHTPIDWWLLLSRCSSRAVLLLLVYIERDNQSNHPNRDWQQLVVVLLDLRGDYKYERWFIGSAVGPQCAMCPNTRCCCTPPWLYYSVILLPTTPPLVSYSSSGRLLCSAVHPHNDLFPNEEWSMIKCHKQGIIYFPVEQFKCNYGVSMWSSVRSVCPRVSIDRVAN